MATLEVMVQSIDKEYINPASGYSNAVTVTANKVKTLYVAGQAGNVKHLKSKLEVHLQSVLKQLAAGGAQFSDVVKMNT